MTLSLGPIRGADAAEEPVLSPLQALHVPSASVSWIRRIHAHPLREDTADGRRGVRRGPLIHVFDEFGEPERPICPIRDKLADNVQ